jgi:hypothetical protein
MKTEKRASRVAQARAGPAMQADELPIWHQQAPVIRICSTVDSHFEEAWALLPHEICARLYRT